MRVSATRWLRSGAGTPQASEHAHTTRSRRFSHRSAVRAAAAIAVPAATLLLLPNAGNVAAAERTPEPELGLNLCIDLTIIVIGCPPPPTTPPPTTPPATNPPATTPPATNPPATNPPATNPPATNPPVTPPTTAAPATTPPTTAAPAIPGLGGLLPGLGGLLPGLGGTGGTGGLLPGFGGTGGLPQVPILEDFPINTPILNCTINLALIAASADCNLGILAGLLPDLPALPDLPPILGLDLNALLNIPLGIVNAEGVIDTDGGIGGSEGLTGDLCLDVAVLAPTAGACPEAQNIGDPGSLVVLDTCSNVAVLAELPDQEAANCPDDDGGLLDLDGCVGVNIANLATPHPCFSVDPLGPEGPIGTCLDVDLDPNDASTCAPTTTRPGGVTTTTRPGGGVTTTSAVGPGTTNPGGPGTTDPNGPGGNTTVPGGPGQRPGQVDNGSLPVTGIAIAGTLVLGVVLVATGAGARLLARIPSRR